MAQMRHATRVCFFILNVIFFSQLDIEKNMQAASLDHQEQEEPTNHVYMWKLSVILWCKILFLEI
jgi:hypothetical protein